LAKDGRKFEKEKKTCGAPSTRGEKPPSSSGSVAGREKKRNQGEAT